MSDQELDARVHELLGNRVGRYMTKPPILVEDQDIPTYSQDLNAMHAAEEKLTPEQSHAYNEYLYFHTPQDQHLFHVTARQRAEAFVAVMENKQ